VVWVCLGKAGFGVGLFGKGWVWYEFVKERLGVVWVCLGKAGCGTGLFGKGWMLYWFL